MSSADSKEKGLWIIIRSEEIRGEDYNEVYDPIVCGVYTSRRVAVEEMMKLYIEDDIDMVYTPDPNNPPPVPSDNNDTNNDPNNGDNDDPNNKDLPFDYRPTVETINEQRRILTDDESWSIYTNRGNKYTLNRCLVGAKHEFDSDVMEMYNQARPKSRSKSSSSKPSSSSSKPSSKSSKPLLK